MKFLLQENEIYELRGGIHLTNRNMHTTYFGTDSLSNLGSKIWKLIPDKTKVCLIATSFQIYG